MKQVFLGMMMVLVAAPAFAASSGKGTYSGGSGSSGGSGYSGGSSGGNAPQGMSPGGSDSCGLGWQVTDKKSLFATTIRGTTNAVIPSTFGMTSGTMGCEKHSFAKRELDAAVYAANNFDALSIEFAQGKGEYITAFATTLGCPAKAEAIGGMVRARYSEVVSPEKASGIELYKNVRQLIRQDQSLSASCPNAA